MRPSLRQVLFRSAGLDLNFAGGVFSLNNTRTDSPANIPGWTFSRTDTNGTATALDLAGNVIQFATGVPRITNRGILVEESRTNVLLRSNEFDNASWTATNSTVTANAGSAPDGTTTADKIIATVASAQHRVDQTAVNSAGTACFSVFLKAAEYSFATIRIGAFGGIVDLSNGSVSGVSVGYTMTATAFPNGWYRCVLTGVALLNDTVRINVQNATGFALSFAGDGTSGILAWGAQFELGAFATSPIITTGAAGTRNGDQPAAGTSVLPPEGTIVLTYTVPPTAAGAAERLYGWRTEDSGNSRLALRIGDAGNNTAPAMVIGDGAAVSTLTGSNLTPGTTAKVACSYSTLSAQAALCVNGTDQTVARQTASSMLSTLFQIGQSSGDFSASSPLLRLQIIPRFLTAAERIALTAP